MLSTSYPGYQSLTDDQFKTAWRDGRVVLDTNVLLGLYRYDEATRTELLSALKRVSERLWMPYQVGLEYNRRRLSVIAGEKRAFDKAAASVTEHAGKIASVFSDKSRNPHPSAELSKRLTEMADLANKIAIEVQALGSALPDVHHRDLIREAISDLFGDRIGLPPTKEWLEKAEAEAKQRFAAGIPPGFEDNKKTESFTDRGMSYQSQHGDLFVWKQILDEAGGSKWPALILVTDDAKEDWWYIEAGKTIGPRAELREEIQRVASVPIFQSYSTAQFLENAKTVLGAEVSDSSIALVREVANPRPNISPNFERMERISRNAVRRWLSSGVNDLKIRAVTPPIDFLIEGQGSRRGAAVVFVPGPPSPEVSPGVLNRFAGSLSFEASNLGIDEVDLFVVFTNRIMLERHFNDLVVVNDRLRSVEPMLRPRFGSLQQTNDGNYSFVPFDLGVFG